MLMFYCENIWIANYKCQHSKIIPKVKSCLWQTLSISNQNVGSAIIGMKRDPIKHITGLLIVAYIYSNPSWVGRGLTISFPYLFHVYEDKVYKIYIRLVTPGKPNYGNYNPLSLMSIV